MRFISAKKGEPEWMLEWRLAAYRRWLTLTEPTWARVKYPKIDFQDIYYYAAPKKTAGPKSLDEVDPQLLATYEKLGIPLREREVLAGVQGARVAVDAVFDSVSVVTTFREELKKAGVLFCSISEAIREYPEIVRKYLGSVVPITDNFYATLNSAVYSDGSFVFVPEGVRCPMELSTYFRINEKNTGQFERTLIIAEKGAYVSYLEGCTAPMRDENQLHAAVVELVALEDAEIKYSTVQNWYPGDADGKGGIYNFVTKRGDCRGDRSKISWTQVETGSAITWKYPSCILRGDDSEGAFYSIAVSNGHQQVELGHQDDPPRQADEEPDHLQGHRRRPFEQHLSRPRHLAPQGDRRAQLHQLQLAADRRQVRRPHHPLYRGEEFGRRLRARGDHLEDLRRHAVLLPQPRALRRGGGGAGGQRLRQGSHPAVADGVRRRGAEADRHLAGRLGGLGPAVIRHSRKRAKIVVEQVKPVMNIADVPLRDNAHGDTFEAKVGSFGRAIGSTGIGVMLHVVEPGKTAFPFHAHHMTQELFVILEGEGTYRFGPESYPIKAGDVCAAPTGGPEVAHQIINTGNKTLKYLGISANPGVGDVAEYPDSGKFAVTSRFDWATGKGGIRYIGRAANSLDYWDGE